MFYENKLCFWTGHVIEEDDKEPFMDIVKGLFSVTDENLTNYGDTMTTFTTIDDSPTEVCITFHAEYVEIETNNAYTAKEIFEAFDEELG